MADTARCGARNDNHNDNNHNNGFRLVTRAAQSPEMRSAVRAAMPRQPRRTTGQARVIHRRWPNNARCRPLRYAATCGGLGGTSLTKARYNCLISRSYSADLIAPASLHWEIGNALSAMFKRNRITLVEGQQALNEYQKIPLRFIDVTLSDALSIADQYSLYAYDACFIACARIQSAPLLSIDNGLRSAAQSAGIAVL